MSFIPAFLQHLGMDVDPSQRNEYLNKAVIYLRNSALLKGLSPIICSVAPSRSERRRFLNVEEGVLNKLKEEGLDLKRYLVLVDVSDDIVLKNAYLRKADTETVEKELKDFKKNWEPVGEEVEEFNVNFIRLPNETKEDYNKILKELKNRLHLTLDI